MTKAELYKDGARLPEQLARLLFLEGVVAGRRVLEVGARSDDVAAFLLSLGAARVVCAVDDRDLVERLRTTSPLDAVDFRAIRPASGSRPPGPPAVPPLPADDGAFDLVIDFGLPGALARGEESRLADLRRLLSPDGFVVTALPSESQAGLRALLAPRHDTDDDAAPLPGYGALVDALRANFPLVQVYFQSLLLGYLFGSFDVEPSGDGIAPQTALLGHEPEPASAYVFAFGNATPVIEDVCLVQIPCATLLDTVQRRGTPQQADGPLSTTTATTTATATTETAGDNDRTTLAATLHALQDAVADRDQVIANLQDALFLAQRAAPSSPTAVAGPAALDAGATLLPGDADGEAVAALVRGLDEAAARVVDLEAALSAASGELERLASGRDALRAERDALAADLVGVHAEQGDLHHQIRHLREENEVLAFRIREAEQELLALDGLRARLTNELLQVNTALQGERHSARADHEALETALAARTAEVHALQSAVVEWRDREAEAQRVAAATITRLQAAHDDAAARAARAEQAAQDSALRVASLTQAVRDARQEAEARLRDAVDAAEHALRGREAAHAAELEALRTALAHASASAPAEAADGGGNDDVARLQDRIRVVEADAVRLAEAVQMLVSEREAARVDAAARRAAETAAQQALLDARHAADAARADADLRTRALQTEVATLRTALDAANDESGAEAREAAARWEEAGRLRRSDQRLLEELRIKLAEANAAVDELTAQRTVLQGALAAREADDAARAQDRDRLAAELQRVTAANAELEKQRAELREEVVARTAEVRRLHAELQEAADRRVEAEVRATHTAADDDARAAAVHALARVSAELDAARAALAEARATGASAADRLRLDADAREARLRADHDVTRDELAQLTENLLQVEAAIAEERAQQTAALAQADAERTRLQGLLQNGQAILDETRGRLSATQQRHEHDVTRLQAEVVRLSEQLQQRCSDEQDEHRGFLARIEALTEAHALAEAARDAAEARAAREAQARAEALADQAAGHEASLAAAREAAQRADLELNELRAALAHEATSSKEKLAEMQRELFEADEMLDNASADMARLEGEVTTLRRAVEEAQRARADEVVALTQRLDDDRVEAARLGALLDERERAVEELRRALHEKGEALSAAEAALGEHRSDDGEAHAALVASLEERTREFLAAREEVGHLERRVDAEHTATTRLQAAHDLLQATLDEARDDANRLRAAHDLLQATLEETRETLAVERSRARLLGAQLEEAQQAVARSHAEAQMGRAVLDEARQALDHERTQSELARGWLVDAREQWAQARAERDALQAAVTAARNDLRDQWSTTAAMEAQVAESMDALQAEREQAQRADVLRRDAEVQLERERAAGELAQAQLVEAQDALARERARADLARAQLDEARDEATAARVRFAAALDAAREEADDIAQTRLQAAIAEQSQRAAVREAALARALDAARAATFAAQEQLHEEQRARADGDDRATELLAEFGRLSGQLRDALAAQEALQVDRAALVDEVRAAHAAAAAATARSEDFRTELQGAHDALQQARRDADDMRRALEHASTNATVPPTFVDEVAAARTNVAAALAARDAADQQRDAAIADLEAARVSARLESRRRADLEAELQRVRAERDQLASNAVRSVAGSVDDADGWQQRVAALEETMRGKDQKIAEQAERIERLTDRIIRSEDVGRGR